MGKNPQAFILLSITFKSRTLVLIVRTVASDISGHCNYVFQTWINCPELISYIGNSFNKFRRGGIFI